MMWIKASEYENDRVEIGSSSKATFYRSIVLYKADKYNFKFLADC